MAVSEKRSSYAVTFPTFPSSPGAVKVTLQSGNAPTICAARLLIGPGAVTSGRLTPCNALAASIARFVESQPEIHGAGYPVYMIKDRSFCTVMPGDNAHSSAALPETCGADIEVPSKRV